MALTSDSTLAEVNAAYDDNVDYDLNGGDQAKAVNFIQACRILLRRLTGDSTNGESRTVHGANLLEIRQAMQRAETWLAQTVAAISGGGVTLTSFERFRD